MEIVDSQQFWSQTVDGLSARQWVDYAKALTQSFVSDRVNFEKNAFGLWERFHQAPSYQCHKTLSPTANSKYRKRKLCSLRKTFDER